LSDHAVLGHFRGGSDFVTNDKMVVADILASSVGLDIHVFIDGGLDSGDHLRRESNFGSLGALGNPDLGTIASLLSDSVSLAVRSICALSAASESLV
jgi:hypothetical protein